MENVLPEQPAEKNLLGYTSPPPPGAGGPVPDAGVTRLRLAGWWRRAGAAVIDGLVVGLPAVALLALILGSVGDGFWSVVAAVLLWLACSLLIAILYAPLLMARTDGRTLGRMAFGIRVVRVDGASMGFKRAFLREAVLKWGLFYGIGALTFLIVPLIDVLWPLWDEQNRALHDLLARTHVVRD
jgi:uncharacterized RDD family membrane protein YckC